MKPSLRWLALGIVSVMLAGAGWLASYFESQQPIELEHGGTAVTAMAYSANGKQLAVGSFSAVSVWDVSSRAILWQYSSKNQYIHSLVYSPDQSLIAIGGELIVELLDAKTGVKRLTLQSPTKPKRDTAPTAQLAALAYDAIAAPIAFSPDGKTLATKYHRSYYPNLDNGFDAICLWDVKTGRRLPFPERFTKRGLFALMFTRSGDRLIARDGYSVSVWTFPGGKLLRTWDQPGGSPWSTTLLNDNHLIAFTDDKGIFCWDIDTGELQWNQDFDVPTDTVVSRDLLQMATRVGFISMIPDDDEEHCGAQLWNFNLISLQEPPQPTRKLIGHNFPPKVAFSPDGRSLATGSTDKVIIWPIK